MYVFLYIFLSISIIGNAIRMIDAVASRDGTPFTRSMMTLWNMFCITSSVILIVLFASR